MEQTALKMIRSGKFIVPVLLVFLLVLLLVRYYTSIKDTVVFPNAESFTVGVYTDAANSGNSEVLDFIANDSVIRLHFLLKDAFQSPYVGVSISPKTQKAVDVSRHNVIQLRIKGENVNRVGVALYTPPLPSVKVGKEDETIYHSYQSITSQVATYTIPTVKLKHPEWWEDIHQLTGHSEKKPVLNEVLHVNIGTAFAPEIQKEKTLEIYSIRFTRNNAKLFWSLGLGYVFLVLLYFGILYGFSRRKHKTIPVTVTYKPVETKEQIQPEEKWLEYINLNFQNNTLNLEQVASETGMAPRRITQLMQEKFQCNFKTYINRIRITEAKRLLLETSLNIGEIAFKVGFNNQSHFNRVFKAEEEINPSEYREKQG